MDARDWVERSAEEMGVSFDGGQVPDQAVAVLEHLTGPSRGRVTRLAGLTLDVTLTANRLIQVAEARPGEPRGNLVARLFRSNGSYEIEALEGRPLWVRGARIAAGEPVTLHHRDMIEFGESGPLSRFGLYREESHRKTVGDVLDDAMLYLRVSRQPIVKRICKAIYQIVGRLTLQTTILFRVGVVLILAILAALTYQQAQINRLLEQRIESSTARLESFAATLARAKEEALTPKDLETLRRDLAGRMSSNVERLVALERRSAASGRVIAQSLSSVVFLQGSYGFRERASGRMLRHVVDQDGRPLISPIGQPLLTLEGKGPVAEREFTGTAFAVGASGALVTNRHVGLPWEKDANVEAFASHDLEPVMIKFLSFLSGDRTSRPVVLLIASPDTDLAILRHVDEAAPIPGLELAEARPSAGDEVIVMGYPTGLRSLLAQSGAAFIKELQETGDTNFWNIAARLAEAGYIVPLASRGIVGQVTEATIVYDAETTHGGSGGPVLDMNGRVLAVNTAILPEYGGSNLGIPATRVRALLIAAGMN